MEFSCKQPPVHGFSLTMDQGYELSNGRRRETYGLKHKDVIQVLWYQTHINHASYNLAQSLGPRNPRNRGDMQQNRWLNLNSALTNHHLSSIFQLLMHQLEEWEKVDRETREACHFDQVSCFSPTYHILHYPREIVIVKWHFFPALSERRISSSLEANTR